jgi:predicted nucleic acid-binding protein
LTEYLLDANVLIWWLRGRKSTIELLERLAQEGALLGVNAIVTAEVYSGLRENERDRAQHLFRPLDYWVIEFGTARLAGELRMQYKSSGHTLAATDTLIAAQAISRGATLVTNNVRDFPMPELKILRYDE